MTAMFTQRARELRSRETPSESKLWQQLRAKRLVGVKFFRQYPVGSYIADFAAPSRRLIIEVDGGGHAEPGQCEYDAERDAWFQEQGWKVIRVWSNEVEKNLAGVIAEIISGLPSATLN